VENTRPEKEQAPAVRAPDDLPETYGAKRVVLLPVAPGKVHVYWEFVMRQSGPTAPFAGDDQRRTRAVLRFYQVAGGVEAPYLDLEVDSYVGHRYVELPPSGGSYVVEFGFRAATGDFFPALRSTVVETPPLLPLPSAATGPEAAAGSEEPIMADRLAREAGLGAEARPGRSGKKGHGKLAAVSASANIKFLGEALEAGGSRDQIRAEMARLSGLALSREDILRPAQPMDLTERCEKRFLFGNSSK